jgi:hypothetical protein
MPKWTLKTINKQKSQEVKLLAEEDNNTKKCQKESKSEICIEYTRHRGHNGNRLSAQGSERIF